MNSTGDNKAEGVTNSRGTRSEKLTGAAIKLVRNVPGLKQSVLSGVAFLTKHETGYLHAKLKKEEEINLDLSKKCDELTSLVASVGKHVESEKALNRYIKTETAAVRRMMFVEKQHQKVERNFPKYAKYLPKAEPLDAKLTAALNEKIAPVIVFTHIQKTAGNSVIAFLQRCLSTPRVARIHELEMASRETIKGAIDSKFGLYDVMSGHIPFARRIDLLLDRPNVNISIMREPVDRVVSLYFYLKANESWLEQGKYVTQNNLSLLEFATSEAYFDNHMVRMLCDLEPTSVPIGQCSEEMLEQAKINIVKNFLLVGLTEKINEFLEVLAHIFCWSLEDVPRENVNELRSPISKFPTDVLDAVAERNKYDVALYKFAKEYWEKMTDSFSEGRI
ncbi:MAG: sulfotransferase family 2 domain-containing protein [Leptolyngbya sp.]|nr:sulfotransferase family 2 domain-containing protein [Candidatus Melainabacteria bacterium]